MRLAVARDYCPIIAEYERRMERVRVTTCWKRTRKRQGSLYLTSKIHTTLVLHEMLVFTTTVELGQTDLQTFLFGFILK
jgi:hypothetical protein